MQSNSRTATYDFTLNLLDGCLYALYTPISLSSSTYTYVLRSSTETINIPYPALTSSVNNGCGLFSYTLLQNWGTLDSNYFNFNQVNGDLTVTLSSVLPSYCGTLPVSSCTFNF